MKTDVDVAWAAGLFEGEGCIHNRGSHSIAVSISMTDLDVLEKLSGIYGGKVTPLKVREEHWKPSWIWYLYGMNAKNFLEDVMPYLGSRRKARADEAIDRFSFMQHQRDEKIELRRKILDMWDTGLYTEKKIGELTGTNRSYVNAVRMGKMRV